MSKELEANTELSLYCIVSRRDRDAAIKLNRLENSEYAESYRPR